MRPTKLQIESGIKNTGKYRQENGYPIAEHQAYIDGWYDAIEFCQDKEQSEQNEEGETIKDINFLKWYSGMEETKIRNAYIYILPTFKKSHYATASITSR